MDYEKAYKEALNWMRSIYPTLAGSDKEDAEHYFPELTESEDERIRKKCIAIISKWTTKEDRDECIAYLEKHKEQKPNIELIQKSWYMEGYNDRDFNKEPKWIIKTGEGGPRYEENPKYGQHLEQKPSEWSEEDEKILAELVDALGEKTSPNVCAWLKSLRPQPKQEWSEEDETIIEGACNTLEVYGHTKLANKLKSLRPQQKQEWSEEDKLMIKCCLAAVKCYEYTARRGDYLPAQFCIDGYLTTPEKVAGWLRSLRPSWKPSEEQMEALQKAVNKLAKTDVADSVRLSIMYDNLKKLK